MHRRLSEICTAKRKIMLNPIIDWSDSDVWEFITLHKIPMNPLYNQGFKRVGCIGCPLSSRGRKELENAPKYKKAYFKAVVKHFEYRKERGLGLDGIMETPEKYFEWWLKG